MSCSSSCLGSFPIRQVHCSLRRSSRPCKEWGVGGVGPCCAPPSLWKNHIAPRSTALCLPRCGIFTFVSCGAPKARLPPPPPRNRHLLLCLLRCSFSVSKFFDRSYLLNIRRRAGRVVPLQGSLTLRLASADASLGSGSRAYAPTPPLRSGPLPPTPSRCA